MEQNTIDLGRADGAKSNLAEIAWAQAREARAASRQIALCESEEKNRALSLIADSIQASSGRIIEANALDMAAGRKANLGTKLDRLLLTTERIDAICADMRNVIALADPTHKEIDATVRPNGLRVRRMRVPIGVVGIIYEARPNVTVDAAALCLKSGNAVVLKGGSDALNSNSAVVEAIHAGLDKSSIPKSAVQLLDASSREVTTEFLRMRGLIDVIIPRGGESLIQFVRENALVPVIETGASVVHAYVDEDVDLDAAAELVMNSKTRRVSICNALDTVLIHRKILPELCRRLGPLLAKTSPAVEVRADPEVHRELAQWLPAERLSALDAQRDFGTEFLDYILAIGAVSSMDEAIDHIERYSLKHTEAIFTSNPGRAQRFQRAVDAACVIHNASTQFTDGGEFGLGAEIGISTQKLHVRGPFALEGLTTTKWVVDGSGQIRP